MNRRHVYLDHTATTPVHPDVVVAMHQVLETAFGNPSSIHTFGREAKQYLEDARIKVANLIGAQPEEIVFTSGGTEADNLAILGVAYAYQRQGNHIITSSIEHHAVLDTCEVLSQNGFEVTFLPVDKDGIVDPDDVRKAVRKETILITVMHANNEIGTVEPIEEIAGIARENGVIFHTDAVQTAGHIPVDVEQLGVDLLSLSAHKFYGPKGVGALYVRKGIRLVPVLHGGGQERNRRAGTENIPGIVGLGKAAEIAARELGSQRVSIQKLRDRLIKGIQERVPEVKLNGHPEKRLPQNVHFSFAGVDGSSLLTSLDLQGIAASAGSACSSGALHPSHVLLAIGLPMELASASLRLTLGRANTEEDIEYCLEVLPEIVAKLRSRPAV
ncbi:MAG TPA: cysteine desulfurase NifS [Syntrophomonadaceae bacterium]|nr:cysteine desulfurase NifS [Syntrophomonadaceae bacterium]